MRFGCLFGRMDVMKPHRSKDRMLSIAVIRLSLLRFLSMGRMPSYLLDDAPSI